MITVTPGPVTHFALSTPATAIANAGFTFSVFADDAKGFATNYTGTVHFTSSDPAAILPGDTTPGASHSFAALLSTPGPQTITVTDTSVPSLTLTSNPITVGSGAHFAVSVPATATAGKPFQFTVTALDASNNVMTGYSGTVHFSSSQFLPTFPADTTLTNGTGTFTATLTTAGYQTIRASDTMSSTPQAGVSETLVSAGPPVSWSMTAPGTAIAGAPFTITVGVIDAYSNAISSYVGNIHFTSSDPQAVLPADSAIHGSNTFQVKLNTAGSFTVLTNDPSGQILQGGASITVSAASAARLIVTAPTTVAAGTTFHVTVTAQDAFGNPTPAYTPLIHFAGSDPAASLPADYVLAPNAQTYSAILNTPGTQTITVTDKSGGAASGTSAPISVGSGSTLHLSVSAPSTALTGTPIVFTVAALNSDNSVATTYNGTVQFSSTASSVTLPANAALVNGSGTFQATFNSLGTQTITAKDIIVPSITGTSASITVSPPPPAQFSIGAPAVATVGVPLTLNIYATTANRGVATGYNGTVRFSSTDPSASLPSNLQLTNGQASFPVTFNTSGNQTVTATDTANSSLTGTTNPISVAALPATHFSLTTPTSALAGAGVLLTITALDANNHQTPAYFGPVHFSSSDPAASLPNDTTLFSGTGFVIVVLKTVGTQTITVSDTISGFSTTTGAITVTKAPATHFGLTLPSSITAGVQFSFTVVALDVANNTATSYGGTVHFSSSDSAAILPANTALTNGTGAFQATMNTAGIFSITVTDTASAITGTASVGVNSGTATHFQVSAPSTATAGTSIQYTVTALDAANNRADHYTGTVRYTSTDAAAVFIQSLQLNSGFGSFPVTLKTAGTQSISVADTANPSTTGNSGPISVVAAPASHFTVSAPSAATAGIAFQVTVTALDPYGNVDTHYTGTVHFTSTDALTALPTNTSVGGGSAVFSVTLNSSGGQKITVSDINTSSINGTSGTVAVSSATGAPSAIGVATGGTGAGYNTTITATFADTAGYLNLHVIDVLINNVLDGRQACYIAFVPSGVNSGSLFLVDDAGDSGGPYAGTTLPGSGIVQNSQCTVSGAASGAGTLLTLTLNVTFNTAFGGDKIVYASAGDQSGANTNWQALGTWSVPGLSVPALSVTGMSPVRSSGFGPTVYTFTFNDAGSFADPNSVENILINTAIDGRHACYLAFQPATSSLFLVDDAGDSAGPFQGMVLPSSNSIGNSQCTIAGAASSVRLNGTTLTLTLSITFSQNLAGNQIFYLAARNSTSNSDWQAAGSAGVR